MQADLEECLHDMDIETIEYGYRIEDRDFDDYFITVFRDIIVREKPDAVMMVNYISPLAELCFELQIPYISWVYDCPFGLRYPERTLGLRTNYVFFFDRAEMLKWKQKGYDTVYHLPLAVRFERLDKLFSDSSEDYLCDVSFIGQMYRNQYAPIRSRMDDYLGGYMDAMIKIQSELYGAYVLRDSLKSVVDEGFQHKFSDMEELISMEPDVFLTWVEHSMAKEITRRERLLILKMLSSRCHTSLYSPEPEELLDGVDYRGVVSAYDEAPVVYHNSRINLNMTLKDITSGVPLRVMEILGSGGFLLSNWQPELAEYFIDGKEVVLYDSVSDAVAKALYYLSHEEERCNIAMAGRKAVERFSFENQVRQIIDTVFNS